MRYDQQRRRAARRRRRGCGVAPSGGSEPSTNREPDRHGHRDSCADRIPDLDASARGDGRTLSNGYCNAGTHAHLGTDGHAYARANRDASASAN